MNEPEPPEPRDWPAEVPSGAGESEEPFLSKILRSAIAPDVLGDAGHDAPLSRRGRIFFWGVVSVLVVAIAVLFLVTVSK